MKNNVFDMNDLTRLYQLYIMTDKILDAQLKSTSGINYETLKKFKAISIRINYLHMQESLEKLNKLGYETRDIYEEQQELNEKVQIMEDVYEARNLLITKYRKYSALPLILEDFIGLDDLDYLREKLNCINEYTKNELYLSKLENSLNTLGIELGNKAKDFEEMLELIPLYEKNLISLMVDDDKINDNLGRLGFDVRELRANEKVFLNKYNKIESIYNEVKDKYDAMNLVDKSDYSDVIREISYEYQVATTNKNIMEVLKLVFTIENDYDKFYEKRISLKTYLIELGENIFERDFLNLLNKQLEKCDSISSIDDEVKQIKEEINKNNALLSRIKKNQDDLKDKITRKREIISETELGNQILKIENSSIAYSKERVDRVLRFVYDKLNVTENDNTDDIFVDENKPFLENDLDNQLFVSASEPFNKLDNKIESYDDTFENISDKQDIFELRDDKSKIDDELYNLKTNIFNDSINPEIVNSNIPFMSVNETFWPNME